MSSLNLLDRVAVAGVDRVRGADGACEVAAVGARLDGDDRRRAGDAGALDHPQAQRAGSDDGDRRPGLDLSEVDHRADAGRHPAAKQRQLLVGQVGVDGDDADVA